MTKSFFTHITEILLGLCFTLNVSAQTVGSYDQHAVFDPTFMNYSVSPFRSANGAPAASYWQNRADYFITASLDTVNRTIIGHCEITYTNNSPDILNYLWLQLDQNLFAAGSRGHYSQGAPSNGGYKLQSVQLVHGRMTTQADYVVSDTRMQIRLQKPLQAQRGKIKIKIDYSFRLDTGQFRQGIMATSKGTVFNVSQWYPRMCVYDDIHGWDALPYQGYGEFYCEYGNFDYYITVPSNMIVAASGELQNPQKVLTRKEINRLSEARQSDKTVYIIAPDEVGKTSSRPTDKGTLTWHFKMENSRDVAWAASAAFVWDAARINLPGGKKAMAMSVYPKESMGKEAWDRATEYLKYSVEDFSSSWYPYPYPVAVNVGGSVGGMEYPGIIFCSAKFNKAKIMYLVTAHEIGHTWFPMIVGSNERRYAFMDEGFNTFIDVYAENDFNKGEFAPKSDKEYDPEGVNPARDFVPEMVSPGAERIMNYADVIQKQNIHPVFYYKTALGLVLLREYILDHNRFDYAFRTYIKRWAYKHPAPEDFFRTMNDATGEDLNWFWKEWFYRTWTLDQAVEGVKYVKNDPSKGALITLLNNSRMVMPVDIKITGQNGQITRLKLPVEIWEHGGRYILHVDSKSPIASVIIDPDKHLPDTDPDNNVWTAK